MLFSALWTLAIIGALMLFMRRQGRAPLLIGIVMATLVLVFGTLAFINSPTRAHYADFTIGAALDTLLLAVLLWMAFAKSAKPRRG